MLNGGAASQVSIVKATPAHHSLLASVISDAFHDLDINRWVVPDPARRRIVDPQRFGLVVTEALKDGAAYATSDFAGVAIWLPCPRPVPAAAEEAERQLRQICGADAPRCLSLERAMAAHHPDPPHWHLALLGVLPDRQGEGLGSALLGHVHAMLDEAGRSAYLEASNERSAGFYRRHGYQDRGAPFPIGPGGPLMYPMWRDPR